MPNFDFSKEVDVVRKKIPYTPDVPGDISAKLKKAFKEIVSADAYTEFAGMRISQADLIAFASRGNLSASQIRKLAEIDNVLSQARQLLGNAAYAISDILNNK